MVWFALFLINLSALILLYPSEFLKSQQELFTEEAVRTKWIQWFFWCGIYHSPAPDEISIRYIIDSLGYILILALLIAERYA